jgi:hypothetical protein
MAGQTLDLPHLESLKRLALSESGFIFDPVTGNSFTVNQTGMAILQLIQQTLDVDQIIQQLHTQFLLEPQTAERDVLEFADRLRGCFQ